MCSNSMASAQVILNQANIKGGRQSGRKVVTHDSMSDLPLAACRAIVGCNCVHINANIVQLVLKRSPSFLRPP